VLSRKATGRGRSARPAARALTALAAVGLAVAVVAGCGQEDSEPATSDDAAAVDLAVTLDVDGPGGEPPQSANVTCQSVDDCFGLEVADFEPVPPATACTQIFGGPDRAELEGRFGDEEIPATEFTRENGCEIERFDRLSALLGDLFPDYRPGASLAP
jgi:hypothetical protein